MVVKFFFKYLNKFWRGTNICPWVTPWPAIADKGDKVQYIMAHDLITSLFLAQINSFSAKLIIQQIDEK